VKRIRAALSVVTLALLCACAAGPDYSPPQLDTGADWVGVAPPGEPELDAWWMSFADSTLDRLIGRALEQNLDLRAAVARIAEARAARDAIAGGAAPYVAARGSVTERRQSENGPLPIGSIAGIERDQTIYELGFDASWELDLAGRTRRGVEAADARVDAAIARTSAARIAVAAEVARSYLSLRGAQQRLAAKQAALAAARQTNALVDQRVEAGEAARDELARSDAELASVAAQLPQIEAEGRAAAFALALLLGAPPEAEIDLLGVSTEPVELESLPVGQRAGLLRRRPDVIAAERELHAATAEIGVATAEMFPRLVIGANGGFQSLDAGNLFEGASETWSIMPALSWRIFDGGRVQAGIRGAEARAARAAIEYESTVLAALNDAERALSRYTFGLDALALQREAVAAARRSYTFAGQRYRAGDIALFELLDAERVLRNAEDTLAALHTGTAVDLVALYKALGGGW